MLGTCTLNLARSASLREAADVLRTDRRTRGEEERFIVISRVQHRCLRTAVVTEVRNNAGYYGQFFAGPLEWQHWIKEMRDRAWGDNVALLPCKCKENKQFGTFPGPKNQGLGGAWER